MDIEILYADRTSNIKRFWYVTTKDRRPAQAAREAIRRFEKDVDGVIVCLAFHYV